MIPEFTNKEDLFDFLKANKNKLISEKKQLKMYSDVQKASATFIHSSVVDKAGLPAAAEGEVRVKVVMNTTNILDSHGDVHIPGLWDKSLSEHDSFYHLQEHKADFSHVLDDSSKAYVQTMTWKELGLPYEGKTQALIFESNIKKDENSLMYDKYKSGKVKNHSVGMRYVQIEMAINSDRPGDKAEKAVWDQYYPTLANKEEAEQKGYFFPVKEAILREGSAVLFGSNYATPTLATSKDDETEIEPDDHSIQPEKSLIVELNKILKND